MKSGARRYFYPCGARLTPGQTRVLSALLNELNEHLEAAIESCVIPGSMDVAPEDAAHVRRDRALRRALENLLLTIERPVRRRTRI